MKEKERSNSGKDKHRKEEKRHKEKEEKEASPEPTENRKGTLSHLLDSSLQLLCQIYLLHNNRCNFEAILFTASDHGGRGAEYNRILIGL